MARERRTKDGPSRALRFVIVGAPKTGKGVLAKGLARKYGTFDADLETPKDAALGALGDYRVEAFLASARCMAAGSAVDNPTFYDHSLIDSLAYVTQRYFLLRDTAAPGDYDLEKWTALTAVVGAMVRDTFRADHILVLIDPDAKDERADLQTMLQLVIEAFSLPYTELEASRPRKNMAQASTIVEGYLNES